MKTTKSHLELYKLMKHRHENKQQFTRQDLLNVYKTHVKPNKHWEKQRSLEHSIEVRINRNASAWINNAILTLIKKGYIGLIFLEDMEKPKEIT